MVGNAAEINNVFINEVAPAGTTVEKGAWAEIYNANEFPVILNEGMYIGTEENLAAQGFQNFLIPAKGFRVVETQALDIQPNQTLTLSAYYGDEYPRVDALPLREVEENATWGRFADGGPDIV